MCIEAVLAAPNGGTARGYQRASRIVGNRGHGHPDIGEVVFYASPALA